VFVYRITVVGRGWASYGVEKKTMCTGPSQTLATFPYKANYRHGKFDKRLSHGHVDTSRAGDDGPMENNKTN
jgi:hypothetical protein